jgi:hypothetical protein
MLRLRMCSFCRPSFPCFPSSSAFHPSFVALLPPLPSFALHPYWPSSLLCLPSALLPPLPSLQSAVSGVGSSSLAVVPSPVAAAAVQQRLLGAQVATGSSSLSLSPSHRAVAGVGSSSFAVVPPPGAAVAVIRRKRRQGGGGEEVRCMLPMKRRREAKEGMDANRLADATASSSRGAKEGMDDNRLADATASRGVKEGMEEKATASSSSQECAPVRPYKRRRVRWTSAELKWLSEYLASHRSCDVTRRWVLCREAGAGVLLPCR